MQREAIESDSAEPRNEKVGPTAAHDTVAALWSYLSSKIHHMYIGPEPQVVSLIPSRMIRVCVDRNVVSIPVPVAAVGRVVWRHIPLPSVEPEPRRRTTGQPPHVFTAVAAVPPTVLPGVLDAIVIVVSAG